MGLPVDELGGVAPAELVGAVAGIGGELVLGTPAAVPGRIAARAREGSDDAPGAQGGRAPGGEFRALGDLPGGLGGRQLFAGRDQLRLALALLRAQLLQLEALLGGVDRHEGHRVPTAVAVVAQLGDGVEEGEEAIELLLRERVVLVVVALGALHGQTHPGLGRGAHPVHGVGHEVLLGNGPALVGVHVVAVEARGDARLGRGVGQEVAGELLQREAIEGQVAREALDQSIAPGPHVATAVDRVAVGVGVARQVEPGHRQAFAVVGGSQEPLDRALVGVLVLVGEELLDLARARRQTGQIQAQPPQQRVGVGLRGRAHALGLEAREHEGVDGVAHPGGILDRGHLRALGGDEGPVRLPGRPVLDPARHLLELLGAQRLSGAGRRHAQVVLARAHALEQLAGVRALAVDDGVAAAGAEQAFGQIEAQVGLARGLVGAVADEAALGQDGPDFAGEVDVGRIAAEGERGCQSEESRLHRHHCAEHPPGRGGPGGGSARGRAFAPLCRAPAGAGLDSRAPGPGAGCLAAQSAPRAEHAGRIPT